MEKEVFGDHGEVSWFPGLDFCFCQMKSLLKLMGFSVCVLQRQDCWLPEEEEQKQGNRTSGNLASYTGQEKAEGFLFLSLFLCVIVPHDLQYLSFPNQRLNPGPSVARYIITVRGIFHLNQWRNLWRPVPKLHVEPHIPKEVQKFYFIFLYLDLFSISFCQSWF